MDTKDLESYAERIERPAPELRAEARRRTGDLALPPRALGRLGDLAGWLAAVQDSTPTKPLTRPTVVVFAADHGAAVAGVSAYPPGTTAAFVNKVAAGEGPTALLARQYGAGLKIVDVAVEGETAPEVAGHKVRKGSGRIDEADAMTTAEAEQALSVGAAIVDAEVDSGTDLLIPASLGVGATTPAAVIVAALCGADAASVTGRGSGIDDRMWIRKCSVIRDALRRARPVIADPVKLLATAGGADLAALTGFLLQAAQRRVPVLYDGVSVAAAALIAQRVAFGATDWWMAADSGPDPGYAKALDRLSAHPVGGLGTSFGTGLGAGSGALLALPVLQAAAACFAELPDHAGAGLPEPLVRSFL